MDRSDTSNLRSQLRTRSGETGRSDFASKRSLLRGHRLTRQVASDSIRRIANHQSTKCLRVSEIQNARYRPPLEQYSATHLKISLCQ